MDVVFNHMTGDNKENVGTAGSTADFENLQYYGVPYGPNDFHKTCSVDSYTDVYEVCTNIVSSCLAEYTCISLPTLLVFVLN